MTTASLILHWGLLIVGLLGSALCAGAEIGAYSVNRVRLHLAAERPAPSRSARILKAEIEHPDRLLLTLLVAVNIFGAMMAQGATGLIAEAGYSTLQNILINVAVLTPVTLILAEALPKELFRLEADRWMYVLARPLVWWRSILTWTGILAVMLWISRTVERLAGLSGGSGESLGDARQRIASLLKETASQGTLSEAQNTLVDRALRLRQATVGDEMLLWSQVRAIPVEWDRAKIVKIGGTIQHARVPVVDRKGRVVGVLRLIDVYTHADRPIQALLAQPVRLTESQKVPAALDLVRKSEARMGIVEKDGKPVGLVTSKDLVEPITGALPDW